MSPGLFLVFSSREDDEDGGVFSETSDCLRKSRIAQSELNNSHNKHMLQKLHFMWLKSQDITFMIYIEVDIKDDEDEGVVLM